MQPIIKHSVITTYGVLCSLIVGFLLGRFYLLQGQLIEWIGIGTTFRPVFNAVWLLAVGTLIYTVHRTTGQLPKPLPKIKAEFKQTGTASYRYVLLQMVIPAIILTSGTSLGPEATLVSSTALYGIWLMEKCRYLNANWSQLWHRGGWTVLGAFLLPHRYRQTAMPNTQERIWTPQTIGFFVVGVISFYFTCKLGGEPSVIVYLGQFNWHPMELAWLLPLMILGYLIGQLELRLTQGLKALIDKWVTHKVALLALGGIAIYLASLWLPAINFSGMANFHLLATSWQQQSIGFLIGSALLKLMLLVICLTTGWIGGDIFPVLFCATAQGIAISQLLPHLNMVFVVGVIAISMGGTILESPLVAGGVMGLMFLPPTMLMISALVTAILVVTERVAFPKMALLGDQLRQQWLPSNYEN